MNELKASGNNAPARAAGAFCTPTAEGFRITEVWESHEAVDRYGDEVIRPAIGRRCG